MSRPRLLLALLAACFFPIAARAHIGSPNVFFEGRAGEYPVHVVIRPAEVIPGLAEISVRVEAQGVQRVTALPIKWNAGRRGSPPPDVAGLVPGEANLYSTQIWFMEPGAQSVELEITASSGTGRVIIPVDAVATRVLAMPKALGAILVVCGGALLALLLSIIGAAVRESMLPPGEQPLRRRRWSARAAVCFSGLLLLLSLWGGKRWWDAEAADYRQNRLYHPIAASAQVRNENDRALLSLDITDPAFARTAPIMPDHGKLMHLFLMREPDLDVFAHLHPVKRDRRTFETALPGLPAGTYRLYADITYETGLSDTLTTSVRIPEPGANGTNALVSEDSDDSWRVASAMGHCREHACRLSPEWVMNWLAPSRMTVNQPVTLHFVVRKASGQDAMLESYLGMRGHLTLRRDDGSVFTHLHPGGSASMAAMQLATFRIAGRLPLKAAFGGDEPICQLPAATVSDQGWIGGNQPDQGISFPYAFPKAGLYRIWVQVKISGQVLTGVFDMEVKENFS